MLLYVMRMSLLFSFCNPSIVGASPLNSDSWVAIWHLSVIFSCVSSTIFVLAAEFVSSTVSVI